MQRKEEEGVCYEDLDPLQLELEELLVSVSKRRIQIEKEMDVLLNWHVKEPKSKDKKSPFKTVKS